eukprot:9461125-Pyramimonas_sp.AAC.1
MHEDFCDDAICVGASPVVQHLDCFAKLFPRERRNIDGTSMTRQFRRHTPQGAFCVTQFLPLP